MNSKLVCAIGPALACLLGWAAVAVVAVPEQGQDQAKSVALPRPVTTGGKPLMEALKARQSSRQFNGRKLPDQVLSNLLWAAWGINRPDSGKRTAPSAMNRQEIEVYVTTADGAYLYDAKAHALRTISAEDIRALTGRQRFVKDAPVNLVYVADLAKMRGPAEQKAMWAAADTGFIAQNVYLFCASEGLATVVRGLVDKPALSKALKLREDQMVILAQTVGYPKDKTPDQGQ